MTAADIANVLTMNGSVFARNRWIVVPNVSWGWGLDYEADLIAVSKTNWADEIEIKINKYDLMNDKFKQKHRGEVVGKYLDKRIRRFWYAIPTELLETALEIPKEFGIVEIRKSNLKHQPHTAHVIRRATARPHARQVTPEETLKLLHLGIMRYWDLRLKAKTII